MRSKHIMYKQDWTYPSVYVSEDVLKNGTETCRGKFLNVLM